MVNDAIASTVARYDEFLKDLAENGGMVVSSKGIEINVAPFDSSDVSPLTAYVIADVVGRRRDLLEADRALA